MNICAAESCLKKTEFKNLPLCAGSFQKQSGFFAIQRLFLHKNQRNDLCRMDGFRLVFSELRKLLTERSFFATLMPDPDRSIRIRGSIPGCFTIQGGFSECSYPTTFCGAVQLRIFSLMVPIRRTDAVCPLMTLKPTVRYNIPAATRSKRQMVSLANSPAAFLHRIPSRTAQNPVCTKIVTIPATKRLTITTATKKILHCWQAWA